MSGTRRTAVVALLFAGVAGACDRPSTPGFEIVGVASIERGTRYADTVVGGLSGIAYDPRCGVYHAVSDDPGHFGPPRFYTLTIDPGGGVDVVGMTALRGRRGEPLPAGSVDLEAIADAGDGSVWVASEGKAGFGAPPFVRRYGVDGIEREELPIPNHLIPGHGRGIRGNLGIEGLALTPDGSSLYAAVESALVQDGREADLERGSPIRILRYDLGARRVTAEFVYVTEPVPQASSPPGGEQMIGVADLAALDDRRLLVLERSFSRGVGNTARVFVADLDGATDVSDVPALPADGVAEVSPAAKQLVLDLGDAGVTPDNVEGMSFGPLLGDGRRLLVFISDDNFNPRQQPTQLISAAVDGAPPPPAPAAETRIRQIQGSAHSSPMAGRSVASVPGVVTAIHVGEEERSAWIQDPQADRRPETSEALALELGPNLPDLEVGDLVTVGGAVMERSFGMGLGTTTVVAWRIEVLSRGHQLPEPVVVGQRGRQIPGGAIDDDGLESFDPASDAIDFFESLEGMRVRVDNALVVGPTTVHGEVAVVADGGASAGPRTSNGGLVALPDSDRPEPIIVDDLLVGPPPMVRTGDRLSGPVVGVIGYSYGTFKLLITQSWPRYERGGTVRGTTGLESNRRWLTIASLNVENLSPVSSAAKFSEVAGVMVDRLRSPAIIAVQEIQDDSGPADDGTTTAGVTLRRLVDAVSGAGGPRYEWRQIDPEDGRDGGRPGANIRVAMLFDPGRVRFADRRGSSREATVIGGPGISPSPGLVAPAHPAFAGGGDLDFESSRKPLVCEFRFGGGRLFVVNLHLISKLADDPAFGRRQPPRRWSERQRAEQAEVIRRFVSRILEHDRDAAVIVLGDFNELCGRPPIRVLTDGGLFDLVERVPVGNRYSFIFQGISQTLDHILVSPHLASRAEVEVVHVNADFPYTERASDHDPVIARFMFGD